MALVNPNIAMSFRQPEIQAPNALAQYAQLQQIQGGQQAQDLARYQLGAAQRAEATQNALSNAYSQSIDPDTGTINYNKLIGSLAKGGGASQIPSVLKTKAETTAAELAQKKTQGEIDTNLFNLQDKKLKFSWNAVGSASTPQAAIAELTKGVKDGVFDMKSVSPEIQQLQSMTPADYQQYRIQKVMGILDAKDKLGFMLPKITRQDVGGQIVQIQDNPAMAGYGLPVQGMAPIAKTATIGDIIAQRNANTSAGQLQVAQDRLALDRDKGTPLTESQGNATAFGMRMKESNKILTELEAAGKKDTGVIKGVVGGAVGLIPFIGDKLEDASGSIFNALPQVLGGLSPELHKVAQALINVSTALLRKESGAAIGASEFATAEKNYFPKPGEGADVIQQKQKARETAIRAMEIQAGPGAKQMGGAGGLLGANPNDPLGLGIGGQ